MAEFEVKVKATLTDTYRVIAENNDEAAKRAEMMFRNDNGDGLVDANFVVRSSESDSQSDEGELSDEGAEPQKFKP